MRSGRHWSSVPEPPCRRSCIHLADGRSGPDPWDLLDRFSETCPAPVGEFHWVSARFAMLPDTGAGAPVDGWGEADSNATAPYSNPEIGCRI